MTTKLTRLEERPELARIIDRKKKIIWINLAARPGAKLIRLI